MKFYGPIEAGKAYAYNDKHHHKLSTSCFIFSWKLTYLSKKVIYFSLPVFLPFPFSY